MVGFCIAWAVLGGQGVPTPTAAPQGVTVQAPAPTGVQVGDRVTVHFLVSLKDGRELADTERRGLPYTFVVGGDPPVRLFDALVRGMAVGEVKTFEVGDAEGYGPDGVPPIVPPSAQLVVRLRLLKTVKAPPQPVPPPRPIPPPAGRLPGC